MLLKTLATTVLALVLAVPAFAADTFPQKPIQFVVPWKPGGSSDLSARILGEHIKEFLGQPLVVSNITGAAGLNAARQVVESPADGYSLLWEHPGNLTIAPLITKGKFTWRDFDVLCSVVSSEMALVVPKNSPVQNVKELFDTIKANPGKIRWSVSVNGTSHFAFLAISDRLDGLDVQLIPTAGDKDRIVGLLGNNTDASCVAYSAAKPYIEAGDLKLLAFVNDKRSDRAPDVPTLKEQGIDVSYDYRCAIFAAKNTPADVKQTIIEAIKKTIASPATVKALTDGMFHIDFLDTAATEAFWDESEKLYRELAIKNKLISD